MSEKNSCISVYKTVLAVEQALATLQQAGVDDPLISVIGKGHGVQAHPVGFYRLNAHIHYQGLQGEFWERLWDLLPGGAFLWVPDFGPMAAAGLIVERLIGGLEGVEVGHGFGVLGAALYSLGIPRSSIQQYEQAIQERQFLVIIHGQERDVEKACTALHHQKQQVTVHRG